MKYEINTNTLKSYEKDSIETHFLILSYVDGTTGELFEHQKVYFTLINENGAIEKVLSEYSSWLDAHHATNVEVEHYSVATSDEISLQNLKEGVYKLLCGSMGSQYAEFLANEDKFLIATRNGLKDLIPETNGFGYTETDLRAIIGDLIVGLYKEGRLIYDVLD